MYSFSLSLSLSLSLSHTHTHTHTMDTLAGIVANINPTAYVVTAEWGKVPLETVFGAPKSASWVCKVKKKYCLFFKKN
jgi:hypothetical protein